MLIYNSTVTLRRWTYKKKVWQNHLVPSDLILLR